MTDNKELGDRLKETLLSTMPMAAPASGGNLVVFRCPFCGDSHNATSKHFYVSLGYDGRPFLFYCHKCKESGLLSNVILMAWGIYDLDIGIKVTNFNKQKKFDNYRQEESKTYNLTNILLEYNQFTEIKLKYINNRLGQNLSYEDLINLKIVLNLNDIIKANNITKLTRDPSIVAQLDRSFIGFISKDNAFLNMRNLTPGKVYKTIDKRWVNYNIFGKQNTKEKFYILPTQIDLNNPQRIKVNIAEGPFDILSIYFNLCNQAKHSIYCAMQGSNYINILKYILTDLALYNIEIHLYIDNDVQPNLEMIANILAVYNIPLYVHQNMMEGEKDFGVPIDKINEHISTVFLPYFN